MAEQKRSTLAACEQELKKGYTETRGYVGVDGQAGSHADMAGPGSARSDAGLSVTSGSAPFLFRSLLNFV